MECNCSGGVGIGSYIKNAVGLEEVNVILENLTPKAAAELLDGCWSSKSIRRLRLFDKGIESQVAAKFSRYCHSSRTNMCGWLYDHFSIIMVYYVLKGY